MITIVAADPNMSSSSVHLSDLEPAAFHWVVTFYRLVGVTRGPSATNAEQHTCKNIFYKFIQNRNIKCKNEAYIMNQKNTQILLSLYSTNFHNFNNLNYRELIHESKRYLPVPLSCH